MSLIPLPVKTLPFIIPKTMDELEREKKTLKELRELAKKIDVDIFGPKGGLITKKPLLKRIKVVYDKKDATRIAEIEVKKGIIREHNEGVIKTKEARIEILKGQVGEWRIKAQQASMKANDIEAEIEELRAVIRNLI